MTEEKNENRVSGKRQLPRFQPVDRIYEPGQVLFQEGQIVGGVFYVQDGAVELRATDTAGASTGPEYVFGGSILGLTEVFEEATYKTSAVCRSRTSISYVERCELLEI